MADAGCAFAVVETSSQGIAQHRHVGIEYDVAVFTNLTPEHIEAHGGFENYKRAKGRLFEAVGGGMKGLGAKFEVRRKEFDGKPVEKALVVNLDDAHAGYFLSFSADKKYGYGIDSVSSEPAVIPVVATDLSVSSNGSTFEISGVSRFSLSPIGKFNVYNALAAAAACRAVGLSWDAIRDAAARLRPVQGRLESVDEGQPFSVIVDYAYEPAALAAAYEALSLVAHGRIIHVLGSAGGGRDTARREVLGRMAAERDDVVIVTNEDPYDDDPAAIIESVAEGARGLKTEGENLFLIPDRAEAIRRAMSLAGPGDLVLITGKGNEPVMAVAGGKKIPWDDRAAAREALHALGYGVTH
jgi:UDP-N-acetylmuramoyl-L-alanyl-D-glutamate--2,6-diaminopimelate ligase